MATKKKKSKATVLHFLGSEPRRIYKATKPKAKARKLCVSCNRMVTGNPDRGHSRQCSAMAAKATKPTPHNHADRLLRTAVIELETHSNKEADRLVLALIKYAIKQGVDVEWMQRELEALR